MFKKLAIRFIMKYRHSTISQWAVLVIDIALFFLSFIMMEAFRGGGFQGLSLRGTFVKLVLSGMLALIFFFISGSYKGIIRHAGMSDIYKILIATVIPIAIFWGVNIINNQLRPPLIPGKYLLSYRESFTLFLLLAFLMIIVRLFMQRIYNEFFRRRRQTTNVVIYGAGAAGLIAYNALHQDKNIDYHVVAYIDDDMSKVNQQLNGVPVMRVRNVLTPKFINSKKVTQLIIAIPSIRLMHKQAISTRALDLGLTVKAVPHVNTWLNGSFSANQIQDVKIEDLLEREPIRMDNVNIVREVVDKVILVTIIFAEGTISK